MTKVESSFSALEQLRQLPSILESYEGFTDVIAALRSGEAATLDGVWGSASALVASKLATDCPSTLVVVNPRQKEVDDFCDDLALFVAESACRFPAWESDLRERPPYDAIYGERLRTLKRLLDAPPPSLIVTCIQSLLQVTPTRDSVKEHTRRIVRGQEIDPDGFLRWLAERGFHHTSAVELPGEFSCRGGIVDVFSPDWDYPVRLELFGDEVESIRRFEVETQRSVASLDEIELSLLSFSPDDRGCLSDYLPPDAWFLVVEPEETEREGKHYIERLQRPDDAHSWEGVMARVSGFANVSVSPLAPGGHAAACRLPIQSVERFSGDMARIREELDEVGEGHQVFLVCQTDAEVKRLREIFGATRSFEEERLWFLVGRLRSGFHMVRESVMLVSGAELFHRVDLRRPVRRHMGKAIDSFLELREGDLVVHLAHGIGRYRGLKLLTDDGRSEDHLELEFHGGTKVYVPATKVDLVQKYVGGSKARPTLAKLGGKSWVRQKQAAQASVTDLAAEMLQLQAARASRPGISFGPDTDWQREFDASFPYHETPDQLTTIDAIKHDMGAARPMDRLLCGDVGFGKTELAMRAAFKAVDHGYQVAILVPTTILAEQHFHTFQQRMAEFPFEIAKLSRFATAREQRETVENLREGRIDIVIGTHRLASRDVHFHNLGLLIIDEEQRFGVEVKDRLKALRTEVDVLTMTATPIPRTLHMSLVGLRDISNLESPPEERLAVETRVSRWNDELIRHAVLRELNRDGQIYFVHNRVHDIEAVARRLGRIVPEAELRIGHGQMPEAQLEQVMVDFVAHRFDLLLATTIVESGLDIPNANTIFIDDADRYGLADLHQLRGRVGRYKHRAYCYLLVAPHQHVTPNAARRLRAIEEFSDMGAGFAIAMRDLEFRGAGNVLGTEQSGHIAAVGYELYCQLLDAAVRRMKQLPPKQSIDVTVDLPGEAYIPQAYVDDLRMKIDLYRRLARIANDEALAGLRAELADRFGPPPPPVLRLLSLAALRIDAAFWQIISIHQEDDYLVFGYTERRRIEQLARQRRGRIRIVDQQSVYLPLPKGLTDPERIWAEAKSVLRPS